MTLLRRQVRSDAARGEAATPPGSTPSRPFRRQALCALRCDRPKRRTVALRASVSSNRSIREITSPLDACLYARYRPPRSGDHAHPGGRPLADHDDLQVLPASFPAPSVAVRAGGGAGPAAPAITPPRGHPPADRASGAAREVQFI